MNPKDLANIAKLPHLSGNLARELTTLAERYSEAARIHEKRADALVGVEGRAKRLKRFHAGRALLFLGKREQIKRIFRQHKIRLQIRHGKQEV